MITQEKIKLFKKYSGNIERWDRFGNQKDKELMTYEEWELLEALIRDLGLIKNKMLSKEYEERVLQTFNRVCDNEKTQKSLKSLIGKY